MQEIRLYTTPVCAYCQAAKRLLGQHQLSYQEVDLARDPELRQQLSVANGGYRTVPMIFIGEEFIGGYDELKLLASKGELEAKVNAG